MAKIWLLERWLQNRTFSDFGINVQTAIYWSIFIVEKTQIYLDSSWSLLSKRISISFYDENWPRYGCFKVDSKIGPFFFQFWRHCSNSHISVNFHRKKNTDTFGFVLISSFQTYQYFFPTMKIDRDMAVLKLTPKSELITKKWKNLLKL